MRYTFILAVALFAVLTPARADDPLIVKQSAYPVSQTLDRLAEVLKNKGITVFTRIDHGAGAKSAGLALKPTQVLIFGNPKLGTPLMQANRHIAVDLPMKAVAWEDDDGKVWLGYTSPDALKARFGIEGKDAVFAKMTGALDNFTAAAVKKE